MHKLSPLGATEGSGFAPLHVRERPFAQSEPNPQRISHRKRLPTFRHVPSAFQHLANSWHEIQVGPVRMINHGIFAAVGAWVGSLIAVALAGTEQLWIIIGLSVAAILAAALWAQLVEGSPQLLRPYGYFGSVAGVVIAALLITAWGRDTWPALAAATIGGALTQAIGRGRCLVQGCCHGSECVTWLGIRYTHPRSRVTRLSTFGDRPLHPTQVYSAGWMLLVAAVLFPPVDAPRRSAVHRRPLFDPDWTWPLCRGALSWRAADARVGRPALLPMARYWVRSRRWMGDDARVDTCAATLATVCRRHHRNGSTWDRGWHRLRCRLSRTQPPFLPSGLTTP